VVAKESVTSIGAQRFWLLSIPLQVTNVILLPETSGWHIPITTELNRSVRIKVEEILSFMRVDAS